VYPYWVLFALCATGAVQFRHQRGLRNQGGPLLAFMILFTLLMVGLRYEVGGDWFGYVDIFNSIKLEPFGDVITMPDPGYTLLNWVAAQIGATMWFVNLVCAAIFAWGLGKFVKHEPNPWLAVLVGIPYLVIVVAMGYTRQAVAIGFILAGLSTPQGRRIGRFWFYILLAATFHRTAIILLPLVALSQTENKVVLAGLGLLLGVVLYYLFLSSTIDRLMVNYVEQEYESQGAGIRITMNLIPAVIFLLFQKRFALQPEEIKLWRNFAWAAVAALVLLFTLPSSTVVDRLSLYLIPLQMVVLGRMPHIFRDKGGTNAQLTLAVIAYSALIQFVWLTSANNAEFWLPYKVYPLWA
jgi:hypothetical protein